MTPNAFARKLLFPAWLPACAALATGCLTAPETRPDEHLALLSVEINPGAVSPTRDLSLKEIAVTLASTEGDTLRDTITEAGSKFSRFPVRLNPGDGSRIVHPVYALDPAKEWVVAVKTRDARDSVLHLDSARAGSLAAGSLHNLRMRLAPRFAAYEAVFALPPDAAGRGYRLSRVKAAVNGAKACAADVAGDTARMVCDYLPVGNHALTLRAYGSAPDDGEARLLYKGAAEVNVSPAVRHAESLVLEPEAPGLGDHGMQVRLGAVGRVRMDVIVSGGLDL